jgi:hypothetical protein
VRSPRETAVLHEEVADVFRIIDASIEFVAATEVVDADYESLSSRHGGSLRYGLSQSEVSVAAEYQVVQRVNSI